MRGLERMPMDVKAASADSLEPDHRCETCNLWVPDESQFEDIEYDFGCCQWPRPKYLWHLGMTTSIEGVDCPCWVKKEGDDGSS